MNLNDLDHIKTPESWKSGAKALWKHKIPKRHTPALRIALAAAAAFVLLMGTALAAAKLAEFQNPTVVESLDDMYADLETQDDSDTHAYAYSAPLPADELSTAEEMIEWAVADAAEWTDRGYFHKTEDTLWTRIAIWDNALSRQYTAETPSLLSSLESDYVHLDVTWLEEHYSAVPYGNQYSVSLTGRKYDYTATFSSGNGVCFHLSYSYDIPASHSGGSYVYIIEDHFEDVKTHVTENGAEFLITTASDHLWADCTSPHFDCGIFGIGLTVEDAIEILDSLDLTVQWEP